VHRVNIEYTDNDPYESYDDQELSTDSRPELYQEARKAAQFVTTNNSNSMYQSVHEERQCKQLPYNSRKEQ